jgi:hypothetical protein
MVYLKLLLTTNGVWVSVPIKFNKVNAIIRILNDVLKFLFLMNTCNSNELTKVDATNNET